jgi:hypothetical protein
MIQQLSFVCRLTINFLQFKIPCERKENCYYVFLINDGVAIKRTLVRILK